MIDYQGELNSEQYAVVEHGDGACLVLAGAGSGKTRTITYRVAYLLERGVPQHEILLLTFTNKAAKEMMERVTKLLGCALPNLCGGTFHSVAVKILRQYAPSVGYASNFTILDGDDAEGMMSLAMRDEGVDLKSKVYPKATLLMSMVSFTRNSQVPLSEAIDLKFSNFSKLIDTLANVGARYAVKKQEANVMDFDDLLVLWLKLLTDNPEIAHALSSQFRYVLVDEYQDTNTIQAAIVKKMAAVHGNILCVGDDAQSIYSFRAANIRNILDFDKDFVGAKIFRLVTNYRSVPEILALANSVIAKNKDQHKKELKSARDPYIKPNVLTLSSTFEEAALIGGEIENLHKHGVAYGAMAVLFRAAHHSQTVEVELMRRGIPYDYRGGLRFFDRAHVKDVLAYLRVRHNVHDVVAWQRLLTMQEGIGDKTANMIIQVLKHVDSAIALATFELGDNMPDRARKGWDGVRTMMAAMVNAGDKAQAVLEAVLSAGYREYLKDRFDNFAERVADIEQLSSYAARSASLEQFLTDTSLSEEYSKKDSKEGKDRVVLSTIHQAKGLEWDTVFVIRLTQGGFPSERSFGEPGGLEEERRLFYVAVTRAQRHLYMTYPMMGGYDGTTYMEPSVFLSDIDPLLIASGISEGEGSIRSLEGTDELEYVSEDEEFEAAKPKKRTGLLSPVVDL